MRRLLTLGIVSLVFIACDKRVDSSASTQAAGQPAAPASSSSSVPAPAPPVATVTPSSSMASAPPASSAVPAASPALRAACAKTCKASGGKCSPQPKCVEGCLKKLPPSRCEPQLLAFMACAARAGRNKWKCTIDDDVPTVEEGVCEPEQAQMARCLAL